MLLVFGNVNMPPTDEIRLSSPFLRFFESGYFVSLWVFINFPRHTKYICCRGKNVYKRRCSISLNTDFFCYTSNFWWNVTICNYSLCSWYSNFYSIVVGYSCACVHYFEIYILPCARWCWSRMHKCVSCCCSNNKYWFSASLRGKEFWYKSHKKEN